MGGLSIDKKSLDFGLPPTAKFPVDELRVDSITITNNSSHNAIPFHVFGPKNEDKFICNIL